MGWPWFWDFPSEFFWFRSVDQLPRFPLPVWNVTGYRADAFVLFYDGQSAMYGLTILQQWMSSCLQINRSGKHLKKWIVDVHFENLLISSKANPRRPNICRCLLLDHVTPPTFPPLPDWRRHGSMNPITCFPFPGNKNSKFSWFWAWVGICALSRQHVYWLEAIQYEEGKSKITTIYQFNFPIYSCTG